MSHTAYNFLADSVFFRDDLIDEDFASVEMPLLERELVSYREHLLASAEELRHEVANNVEELLSITFGTDDKEPPPIMVLKRCALYYDRAIVDDPLFALTSSIRPDRSSALDQLSGLSSGLSRRSVSEAARYMRTVTPMIAGGFLKFYPISHSHEPASIIPVRTSASLFEEGIPELLRATLQSAARVRPMRQDGNRWLVLPDRNLSPTRSIAIDFDGLGRNYAYKLFATHLNQNDEDSSPGTILTWLPAEPPEEDHFNNWVTQSVNQAAQAVLRGLAADVLHAQRFHSMFWTSSPLEARLLTLRPDHAATLEEDLARLAIQFELPILESVSVSDLMRVRVNDGEAFENFRRALQRQLRDLRGIEDDVELSQKIQEISNELAELQVREVDVAIRTLRRDLLKQALIATASVAAVPPTSGASLLGLLNAASQAHSLAINHRPRITGSPAYFLWRLGREAR